MKNKNHIKGKKEYTFNYAVLPLELFNNKLYSHISSNAKLLYSLLLNRTSLSLKNHFIDNKGRAYIFFTRDEAKKVLHCSNKTAIAVFKELVTVDLIEERHQNGKKANMIFVKLPLKSSENIKQINKNIKAKKTLIQNQKDFLKKLNTNIKFKQKKLNAIIETIKFSHKIREQKNVSTIKPYDIQLIKQQIEYDYFKANRTLFGINTSFIDTVVTSIAQMRTSEYTKINDCYYTRSDISHTISDIDSSDIIDLIKNIKLVSLHSIKNLKAYIKSAIFNIVHHNRAYL